MQILRGDLVKLAKSKYFNVIVHGANCFVVFGAGIAKQIKDQLPAAYEADCQTVNGDRNKLGSYSAARYNDLTVVNAYTQFDTAPGINADYDAIRSVMAKIKQDFHGSRIGLPMIGAGLAGGDWRIISQIIDEELAGEDVTLVLWDGDPSTEDLAYDLAIGYGMKLHSDKVNIYSLADAQAQILTVGIISIESMKYVKGTLDTKTMYKKVYQKLQQNNE